MTTEAGTTAGPTAPKPRRRLRLSVRALLGLVAVLTLSLFLHGELKDGMPPRFVLRGIPARMARLKEGMSRAEAHRILGFDRPWYRGGIGPVRFSTEMLGILTRETADLRPARPAPSPPPETIVQGSLSWRDRTWTDPPLTSTAINLDFDLDRLLSAAFRDESGRVTYMIWAADPR